MPVGRGLLVAEVACNWSVVTRGYAEATGQRFMIKITLEAKYGKRDPSIDAERYDLGTLL